MLHYQTRIVFMWVALAAGVAAAAFVEGAWALFWAMATVLLLFAAAVLVASIYEAGRNFGREMGKDEGAGEERDRIRMGERCPCPRCDRARRPARECAP